jgi:hypothetical protein
LEHKENMAWDSHFLDFQPKFPSSVPLFIVSFM